MTEPEAWAWLMSLPNGFCVNRYSDRMFLVTVQSGKLYLTGFQAIFPDAVAEVKAKLEAAK